MGHERIVVLPKSQQWRDVVQLIASLQMSEIEVSDIVKKRYRMSVHDFATFVMTTVSLLHLSS